MRPRLLALVALLALWNAAPRVAAAETAHLVLLHTTDLHGALDDYDYLADRPAPRGLTRIATLVSGIRAANRATLLLDAGDAIQGGAVEATYHRGERTRPEPMMTAMSRIGYDAMAVGNHEFSYGAGALDSARRAASFPWLAANVVRAADGSPAFDASIVKVVGGVRVGIVGLTTPAVPLLEDSAHVAGLKFLSPLEVARAEVERLRKSEHCDVVVLLAHTGFEKLPAGSGFAERRGDAPDENWGYRLATEVPGADVAILGHTHARVPSIEAGVALATQAGRGGETLGRVDLELSRSDSRAPWSVVARHAELVAVTDSVAADSALSAFARPYHLAAEAALDQPIGSAAARIDSPHGRLGDGPLWELIQNAQLAATGADVSLAPLFDPAAAIEAGPVAVRDVERIYPYDNTLVVVELTGAQLKSTLERGARYFADYTYGADRPLVDPAYPGYNFDAAEGVTYEVDLTRPAGDRVINLTWKGRPLAPGQTLKVVVSNYRANGGGDFEEVRAAPRISRGTRQVSDLIVDYVRANRSLTGGYAKNWRLLPDYAASPERPLIDRLVRQGVAPRAEVQRLEPDAPAQRGDLAYWLARSFGWRENRASGAFPDVPDSLEPWLDGLLRRHVLGTEASAELIKPFANATLPTTLDWCERAAWFMHYALAPPASDQAFRRGLLTGTDLATDSLEYHVLSGALSRAQLLGLISNLRFPTVRVLETTDLHGALLSGARERRTNRVLGGSAVLAAHLQRLERENPEGTVLLDGGDLFQGTMISNLQFGRPVVEQMNALGYAATAIGNHEFDWGADTLARRIAGMRFAALGANVAERRSGRRPRWARADTIVARRGVRIAILGLCYRYTPTVTLAANVAALRFDDDSATAARLVPGLRKDDHALVVVGLGHIPAESDTTRHARGGDLPRLARVPGVDLWLGGHSHNLVDDRVNDVPILIAGAHGEAIAVCDLVVDPVRSRVVERSARLVQTYADEVHPDSAMAARVERWNRDVAPIAAVAIGRNAQALARGGLESPVGDFVTDAMRARVKSDVALQNSGGLRADLAAGEVTRGAIYEVMPFDNTIFTMDLTGAELKLALEQALKSGRVTQVSGIAYTFDNSRPDLDRIVALTLSGGAPVDTARTYHVACNNFMATGGDENEMLSRGAHRTDTGVLVRDAMESMVVASSANGGALEIKPGGRIARQGGRAPDAGPSR